MKHTNKFIVALLTIVLLLASVGSVSAGNDWQWAYEVVLLTGYQGPEEDCESSPNLVYCEPLTDRPILEVKVNDTADPASYGISLYGYIEPGQPSVQFTLVWFYPGGSVNSSATIYEGDNNKYIPFPLAGQTSWTRVDIVRESRFVDYFVDAVKIWDSAPPQHVIFPPASTNYVKCLLSQNMTVVVVNSVHIQLTCEDGSALGSNSPLGITYNIYYEDILDVYCYNIQWTKLSPTYLKVTCP